MRACLAAALLACAPPAAAATIQVHRQGDSDIAVIYVEGEFRPDDGEHFARAAAQVKRAIVVFQSPGGALIAGLQIGKIIRLRKFPTFVGQENYCASACAIAWLAGVPRAMQDGARIGFHAAYFERAGVKVGANVGNALIGAYLHELGLSTAAIVYVESAEPDEITWLTMADARKIGLEVKLVAASPQAPKPADPPRRDTPAPPRPAAPSRRQPSIFGPELAAPLPEDSPDQPIETLARAFVRDYFAHWSEAGPQAMEFFQGAYAPQVSFYGRELDRDTVLVGKRSFTEKWPTRIYVTQPDSIQVFCNAGRRSCTISGVVDWDCRNGGASTRGSAQFTITASLAGARPAILAENGAVIARRTD